MKNGETAFFNGKLSDVEEKLRGGKVLGGEIDV